MVGALVFPEPHAPVNTVFTSVAVRCPSLLPHVPVNMMPPTAAGDLHAPQTPATLAVIFFICTLLPLSSGSCRKCALRRLVGLRGGRPVGHVAPLFGDEKVVRKIDIAAPVPVILFLPDLAEKW